MKDLSESWKLLEENLKGKRQKERREKLAKENSLNQSEYYEIQKGYFDLLKNCTILSGTIFASSVALATGKTVNSFFLAGELLLLVSTIFGALYLLTQLKGKESFYFLMTSWRLETDLISNKDVIEDFEKEQIEKSIKEYKTLYDNKSVLYYFLKIIKIDWFPSIFFVTLFSGLICIWVSLSIVSPPNSPSSNFRNNCDRRIDVGNFSPSASD